MNGNLFLFKVKGMFQCVKIAITIESSAGRDGCPDCARHRGGLGHPMIFDWATRLIDV